MFTYGPWYHLHISRYEKWTWVELAKCCCWYILINDWFGYQLQFTYWSLINWLLKWIPVNWLLILLLISHSATDYQLIDCWINCQLIHYRLINYQFDYQIEHWLMDYNFHYQLINYLIAYWLLLYWCLVCF